MAAQLANFTVHGGKKIPPNLAGNADQALKTEAAELFDENSRIFSPISLDELNNELDNVGSGKKFLIHIRIPQDARALIKKQLETLSVSNASLYPEFDYQTKYVTDRWTKKKS